MAEARKRLGRARELLAGGSDPEVEILPAIELGWARLSSADTKDLNRTLAIGCLHASLRTSMAKGVDGIFGVQTGYVLTPTELKRDAQKLGGFAGTVIGVTVGLAGIL